MQLSPIRTELEEIPPNASAPFFWVELRSYLCNWPTYRRSRDAAADFVCCVCKQATNSCSPAKSGLKRPNISDSSTKMSKVKKTKPGKSPVSQSSGNLRGECAECEAELKMSDGVVCVDCDSVRHMNKKCSGFSKATYDKDKELKSKYICKDCNVADSSSESESKNTSEPNVKFMQQVMNKLSGFERKLDSKLRKFQSFAELFSETINQVTECKSELDSLSKRVKKLDMTPKTNESKPNEVIVTNVPPLENENTEKVAEAILKGLDAKIGTDEIQQAFRFEVNKDGKKRHFLKIRMNNDAAKGRAIKAARAAKATLKDLDLEAALKSKFIRPETGGEEDHLKAPIFINEAVSKSTSQLLQSAVKSKKDNRIQTAWTYHDKVYVRKLQGSKPVLINSEAELASLLDS